MKILGSPGSPYVRKARAFAAEKGIDVQYAIDRPNVEGSRVPGLNPLGKIPVLLLDDGDAIYDSVVVVQYLEGLRPVPRLIPDTFRPRIEVLRWEALGDGMCDAAINISHDHGPMHDAEKQAAWLPRQQAKLERSMAMIERAIAGREWLHGDTLSLADVAVVCAISYLDQALASYAWRKQFPGLIGYYDKVCARPSFRATDPKPS